MPDDPILTAKITVDAGGFTSGFESAASAVQGSLERIKAELRSAQATAKAAAADFAAFGAQVQAAGGLTASSIPEYEALVAAYDQAQTSVKTLTTELQTAQPAVLVLLQTIADSTAVIADNTSAINGNSVSLRVNTGAALSNASAFNSLRERALEARVEYATLTNSTMGMGFAMAQLAARSELLGPLVAAVFPVALGIAFGEILSQVVEKVYEWYYGLEQIKELNDTLGKQYKENGDEYQKFHKEALEANFKLIGAEHGRAAEFSARAVDQKKHLDDDKEALQQEQGKLDAYQKQKTALEGVMKANEAAQRAATTTKVGRGGAEFTNVPDTAEFAAQSERLDAQNKQLYDLQHSEETTADNIKKQKEKVLAESTRYDADMAEERKHAAEEAKAALRQAESDMRKLFEDQVEDLKLYGDGSLQKLEELVTRQVEIARSKNYPDVVRNRNEELISVRREALRQGDEINQKSEEQLTKRSEIEARSARGTAPVGGGERAELADLKKQQAALYQYQDIVPQLYDNIQNRISEIQASASREQDNELKKTVDEAYVVWKSSGDRTLQQITFFWESVKAVADTDSAAYREAVDKIGAAQDKIAEEKFKSQRSSITADSDARIEGIEKEQAAYQRAQELSTVKLPTDKTNELKEKRDIDQQIYAEHIAALDRQIEADKAAGDKGVEDFRKDTEERQKLQAAADLKMYQDTTAILAQEKAVWDSFFNDLNRGFETAVNKMVTFHQREFGGMVTRQNVFNQAMIQMWDSLAAKFDTFVLNMVLKWAEGLAKQLALQLGFNAAVQVLEAKLQTILTVLHLAGLFKKKAADTAADAVKVAQVTATQAAVTAITTQAAATQKGIITAVAEAEIASWAAVAGAATAAAVAAETLGDIGAAIAAGVAMDAAVETTFGSTAAFEKGGIVPNTGVALVHKGEAVLPRPLTDTLLNASGKGGGTINVGGIHLHGNYSTESGRSAGKDAVEEIGKWARKNNMRVI